MKFIIPIIVGGIIGYFTNWLAIKMLFRPYEEKRIFGLKIPFTPGLIPKERHRVAKSVGNTVGEYLLTPEMLVEVVSSDKTIENIKDFLNIYIDRLKRENRSIKHILEDNDYIKDNNIIDRVKFKISDILLNKIRDKNNKIKIINLLEYLYDKNIEDIDIYIKENSNKIILENINSKENKSILIDKIVEYKDGFKEDNRKLKEILPEDINQILSKIIFDNEDMIIKALRDFIRSPKLIDKIKKSINSIVSQNISPIITTFISKESISEKIYNMIDDYIDSREAEELVIEGMDSLLNNILDKEVNQIIEILDNSMDRKDIDFILDNLIKLFNENKLEEKLTKIISKEIKNRYNRLNIIGYIYKNIDDFIREDIFKDFIYNIIDKTVDKILNIKVSNIAIKIEDRQKDKLYMILENIIKNLDYNLLIKFIEILDISTIVEEQINSFDIEFGEELILEIAGKELKAITNLGALLGAFMGMITPLLQRL